MECSSAPAAGGAAQPGGERDAAGQFPAVGLGADVVEDVRDRLGGGGEVPGVLRPCVQRAQGGQRRALKAREAAEQV